MGVELISSRSGLAGATRGATASLACSKSVQGCACNTIPFTSEAEGCRFDSCPGCFSSASQDGFRVGLSFARYRIQGRLCLVLSVAETYRARTPHRLSRLSREKDVPISVSCRGVRRRDSSHSIWRFIARPPNFADVVSALSARVVLRAEASGFCAIGSDLAETSRSIITSRATASFAQQQPQSLSTVQSFESFRFLDVDDCTIPVKFPIRTIGLRIEGGRFWLSCSQSQKRS